MSAGTARSAANPFFYLAGIGFLALAKSKHLLSGYSTPKPFALHETDRCIDYDVGIAEVLLRHLERSGGSIAGAHVLELGPGSDLGVGLCLLAKGAAQYTAFDRHCLANQVPAEFYARFGKRLGITPQLERCRYIAREDFDLVAAVEPESIDIVLSNAAFEHFDDVERTVQPDPRRQAGRQNRGDHRFADALALDQRQGPEQRLPLCRLVVPRLLGQSRKALCTCAERA